MKRAKRSISAIGAIIYILQNKKNDKYYVGKTTRSLECRVNGHLKNDSIIGNALRKNGLDGFTKQQIIYHKKEIDYWEKYFIKKLNAVYPNGYNLTFGGEGGKKSEKAKRRMRHPKSSEGREAIAISNRDLNRCLIASMRFTGDNNPAKRPEVRKLISIAMKESDHLKGENNYFSTHPFVGEKNWKWLGDRKKIVCVNPDCGKIIEVRPSATRKYCNQKCMGADPERSRNASEKQKGKELSESHLENILIAQRRRRHRERACLQRNLKQVVIA
jgi:hypothetical protein